MAPLLRHRLTTALGWLLFALAYYLPVLPLQGNTVPPDERVQLLLQQALHTPAVQWDLLREVTQLGLLALYGWPSARWPAACPGAFPHAAPGHRLAW
jgi:hypothetical protein